MLGYTADGKNEAPPKSPSEMLSKISSANITNIVVSRDVFNETLILQFLEDMTMDVFFFSEKKVIDVFLLSHS